MKTKKNLLLLLMLLVLPFTLQAETFNVKKYGARGNGKKMDSPAIQKAIELVIKRVVERYLCRRNLFVGYYRAKR